MNQSPKKFRGFAVDIGNSAVHVGYFDGTADAARGPSRTLVLDGPAFEFAKLTSLLSDCCDNVVHWNVASVNDRAYRNLTDWLADNFSSHRLNLLSHTDCSLAVEVDHPGRVGVDRLMAVVAAHAMRGAAESAIVIDAGTAITVDCLTEDAFRGGAILPGMRMSAAALDRYTQKLPLVATDALSSPPSVGRHTEAAIASGIYWGSVGAIRELVRHMSADLPGETLVFITGGDGRRLADHLELAEYVPHMVLVGIALTATCCEGGDG